MVCEDGVWVYCGWKGGVLVDGNYRGWGGGRKGGSIFDLENQLYLVNVYGT